MRGDMRRFPLHRKHMEVAITAIKAAFLCHVML